jgi:3'-5' exoribonuclease
MLELAESISSTYNKINKDLLFCGCILHDIGKINELKVEFGTKYTDEGELLSHIPIGHSLISEKISKMDNFPTELTSQILHMILSHHGKPSWDKPSMVEPKTLEAVSLHHIDMLSAKLSPIHDIVGESEGWQKISNNYYLVPSTSKD